MLYHSAEAPPDLAGAVPTSFEHNPSDPPPPTTVKKQHHPAQTIAEASLRESQPHGKAVKT